MNRVYHRETLEAMEPKDGWSPAEQRLIAEAKTGVVSFAPTRPARDAATRDNTLRAGLIRHMVLGGCEGMPVPDKGVGVRGAVITGLLDLEGCDSPDDLYLDDCAFDTAPMLRDASLGAVWLPGFALPGLDAQGLHLKRDLHLTQGFAASGTVDLTGATVGGQISCERGQFDGGGGPALVMDAATVGADLFLRDGFTAKGLVSLARASVTGQVACVGGQFDGGGGPALNMNAATVGASLFLRDGFTAKGLVNLRGATVTGQVDCTKGRFDGGGRPALVMDAATVGGSLFLRDGFTAKGLVDLTRAEVSGNLRCHGGTFHGGIAAEGMQVGATFYAHDVTLEGRLDLTDASVGRLKDDAGSWSKATSLKLSGFRYQRLTTDMSLKTRFAWLDKSRRCQDGQISPDDTTPEPYCDPQPYTQLAQVLEAKGASGEAAQVREVRDGLLLADSRRRVFDPKFSHSRFDRWMARCRRPFDWLFGRVFGYGHRPGRALFWAAGIVLANALFYQAAYEAGQMAPVSPMVLTSGDWIAAVEAFDAAEAAAPGSGVKPLLVWQHSAVAQDYTTFSAGLYALDLFVPIVHLGQETDWAPSPARGLLGRIGHSTGWFVKIAGWVITAIAAAAVTGFVGRKD